ncbi:hypothetical protein R3P38DRAFT_2775187 [Favolaschia claudopus]|uniref:Uncharacterized protein n=1 Tax=Favolaschia claudopus TaxID=2862362 RepID=A0AAW0BSC0_9AGAR
MSRPEKLRSGEYWQDVRRRSKEAKAAREARIAGEGEFAPSLCDGAQVFTFAPGHSQPFVSVQHPGGRLLPVSGPSNPQSLEARRRMEKEVGRQKKRCQREAEERRARTQALRQSRQKAADADAALLARLRRGRAENKRRAAEHIDAARPLKKCSHAANPQRVVEPVK